MPLLLWACGKTDHPTQADARKPAEAYYERLIAGDAEGCVSSLYGYETMPEEYRSQLRDLFAQHIEGERQTRGGLVSAVAVGDTLIDSFPAVVFLEVTFGFEAKEIVSLPIVLSGGEWRPR